MATNFSPVQAQKFKLAGAGITSAATTIVLKSFKTPDSTNILTANFGALGLLVIDPGTSREETVSFTTVTQNADGTASLTGVTRGLGFIPPYSETTALKLSHSGGSIAVLSNPAALYGKYTSKANDEAITGYWTVPTPLGANDVVNKAYADALAMTGTGVSTDSLKVAGIAGETVAAGQIIYLKEADGRWWLADADLIATIDGVQIGVAQGAGTAGNNITGGVLLRGVDSNQSGLTAGTKYYLSNTAGGISSSVGTLTRVVGNAKTTTALYFDVGENIGASETSKGIVEEATDAEVTAGTATGATGAKLFITPAKLLTYLTTFISTYITPISTYAVGAFSNSAVKTYFNIQLPFILWTGSANDNAVTDFDNWQRTSSDVYVAAGGAMLNFEGTSSDYIYLQYPFRIGASDNLQFDNTNIIIMDWWAKLPASGTGDINMGFGTEGLSFAGVYNDTSGNGGKVAFCQKGTGELYATIAEEGVGVTNTDISSGLTLTNWNNYRIELDLSNEAKFYVNGTLKATLSGANLEVDGVNVYLGFGRSDTSLFQVTAPNLSLQMNP